MTTRSNQRAEQFASQAFKTVVVDVAQPDTLTDLPSADVVVFSIGFDRRSSDDIQTVYVDGLKHVLKSLNDDLQHLIYISSTGVLASSGGNWIDESAATKPVREGARAHLEAEHVLSRSKFKSRSTILRLAGIYGPNRVPHLNDVANRRWQMLPASGHVNLIHVDDAARITDRVVELRLTESLYHVSDGTSPTRKRLYDFVAAELGLGAIDWSQPTDAIVAVRSSGDKRISNKKLVAETQYQFLYPDYQAGVKAALAETELDLFQ